MGNPVFPAIVRGIEDYLDPLGYTPLVTNTDADPEREQRALRALAARPVDGFLATGTEAGLRAVSKLIDQGRPVVLINRSLPDGRAFSATPDDRRGATSAVEHLVALGHTSIVHVGGPQALSRAGAKSWLPRHDARAWGRHRLPGCVRRLVHA